MGSWDDSCTARGQVSSRTAVGGWLDGMTMTTIWLASRIHVSGVVPIAFSIFSVHTPTDGVTRQHRASIHKVKAP